MPTRTRTALLGLVASATVGVLASVGLASASTLQVDGGVIQHWEMPADFKTAETTVSAETSVAPQVQSVESEPGPTEPTPEADGEDQEPVPPTPADPVEPVADQTGEVEDDLSTVDADAPAVDDDVPAVDDAATTVTP